MIRAGRRRVETKVFLAFPSIPRILCGDAVADDRPGIRTKYYCLSVKSTDRPGGSELRGTLFQPYVSQSAGRLPTTDWDVVNIEMLLMYYVMHCWGPLRHHIRSALSASVQYNCGTGMYVTRGARCPTASISSLPRSHNQVYRSTAYTVLVSTA